MKCIIKANKQSKLEQVAAKALAVSGVSGATLQLLDMIVASRNTSESTRCGTGCRHSEARRRLGFDAKSRRTR